MRVLVLTNLWPIPEHPAYGVFVAAQMRSVAGAACLQVHFINGHTNPLAYLRSALRIARLNWNDERFDLIHAHTGHCGALALIQRRIPVLTSFVGYDVLGEPSFGGRIPLKSRVESTVFRGLSILMQRTITKSAEMERALPRRVRGRNTVLPNGVDRSLFRPMPRAAARHELGWPQDEPVVLFIGDPGWGRKRFDLASSAVELAREQFPRLQLRVCAHLPQAEVVRWLNAADALILTSYAEGSPNAVKEAMACDLPIVSVDTGDVREVIEGTLHCHVTAGEPEALARALCEVLEAAPERSDGRSRSAHLALEAIAQRLLEVYAATASARLQQSFPKPLVRAPAVSPPRGSIDRVL